MLAATREFFAERGVLEVETPLLSAAAVTDPQIESLRVSGRGLPAPAYLASSPEFAMKRLLAAGSGDIYQICKAFRDEERGRWHNPEFTLVEWYRVGFDDAALMQEVEALIAHLLGPYRELEAAERLSHAAALERYAGIVGAHGASHAELDDAVRRHGIVCTADLSRDATIDLLMGLVVGPQLGHGSLSFIYDYPVSQAALARLKPGPPPVAARFECYLDGIELANGFHELTDAALQRARFQHDLEVRRGRGQFLPPPDEHLLAAIEAGMPDCAGVALGFDRLVAVALRAPQLADGMAFTVGNA
jgi:lysyl-tRNA synthetase class 2